MKGDLPVNFGKECVISSHSNIVTRIVLSASLANNDIAGLHDASSRLLYAEPLGAAVSPVSRASHSFFMGKQLKIHGSHPSLWCHIVIPEGSLFSEEKSVLL
jgi:hypothetical protein